MSKFSTRFQNFLKGEFDFIPYIAYLYLLNIVGKILLILTNYDSFSIVEFLFLRFIWVFALFQRLLIFYLYPTDIIDGGYIGLHLIMFCIQFLALFPILYFAFKKPRSLFSVFLIVNLAISLLNWYGYLTYELLYVSHLLSLIILFSIKNTSSENSSNSNTVNQGSGNQEPVKIVGGMRKCPSCGSFFCDCSEA